jgi:hypothetical protein
MKFQLSDMSNMCLYLSALGTLWQLHATASKITFICIHCASNLDGIHTLAVRISFLTGFWHFIDRSLRFTQYVTVSYPIVRFNIALRVKNWLRSQILLMARLWVIEDSYPSIRWSCVARACPFIVKLDYFIRIICLPIFRANITLVIFFASDSMFWMQIGIFSSKIFRAV